MNKEKDRIGISKPILVFCIILVLVLLMSCSKEKPSRNAVNVNKSHTTKKVLIDKNSSEKNEKEINSNKIDDNSEFNYFQDKTYENKSHSNYITPSNDSEDLSNIRNTYYGKYEIHGEEVLGNFEVTRNSIIFTPDNGHSKEVIHFSGMKNIDKVDYPNGKIDLSLEFDGYEKTIKNVSESMFSDVLLYTTK